MFIILLYLTIYGNSLKLDDYASIYDLLDIYENRYKNGIFCPNFVYEFNAQFAKNNLSFIENTKFFKYFLSKQEYEQIKKRLNIELFARKYLIFKLNSYENCLTKGLSEFTIIEAEIKELNIIKKEDNLEKKIVNLKNNNLENLNYNIEKLKNYIKFIPKIKLFHLFYLSCIDIRQIIFKTFINYQRIFRDKNNIQKVKILHILKGRQTNPIFKFVILLLDVVNIEDSFNFEQKEKWKKIRSLYI